MSIVDIKSLENDDNAVSLISDHDKDNSLDGAKSYKLVVVNPEKV